MLRLREVGYLVRKAQNNAHNAELRAELRRRVWLAIQPRGDGFLAVVRAKDAADVVPDSETDTIRGARWRLQIGSVEYRISGWEIVEAEKPRQFIGLRIVSNAAGGNEPPFSSQAV